MEKKFYKKIYIHNHNFMVLRRTWVSCIYINTFLTHYETLHFAYPSDLIDQNDGLKPETITEQVHTRKGKSQHLGIPLPKLPIWLGWPFSFYTSYLNLSKQFLLRGPRVCRAIKSALVHKVSNLYYTCQGVADNGLSSWCNPKGLGDFISELHQGMCYGRNSLCPSLYFNAEVITPVRKTKISNILFHVMFCSRSTCFPLIPLSHIGGFVYTAVIKIDSKNWKKMGTEHSMVTLPGLELIYRGVHLNSIEKLGVSQTIMMEITS